MLQSRWVPLALLGLLPAMACNKITPLSKETYPPHSDKVCILDAPVPDGYGYTEVAQLHVEFNSYGGDRKAKGGLAKFARKVGGQAVINPEFRNMMGAPRGDGTAVRWDDGVTEPPAACEWY